MKVFTIICAILILFSVMFPILYTLNRSGQSVSPNSSNPEDIVSGGDVDKSVSVNVLDGDKISAMNIYDYLVGVVAAEMPASFENEALKSQAVAARTYTVYKMTVNPSSNHPDADVCTDSACCKAYISVDGMREKWGDSFDEYYEKISSAVASTDGVCLTYENEPILSVFHSSSAGKTENSGDIWSSQLPYLVSVDSPEDSDTVPNFVETVKVSYDDFKNTVTSAYSQAVFSDDKTSWISNVQQNSSGRLDSATIGGVTLSGSEIRSLFSLRSSAITFSSDDDGISITTTGYGHGVGMSQYGAETMAKEGSDYKEILQWYYTGVSFGNIKDYV